MDPWRSQSQPGKQRLLAAACAVVGLLLAMGFRGAGAGGPNAAAGFWLGVLLAVGGLLGLLLTARQAVVVDPRGRRVLIEDVFLLGTRRRAIPFGDILGVGIGYLGKRSNFVTMYYLVLTLRSGEEYPLFAPGRFFEGASDRSTVEGWRQRLEQYLGR